MSIITIERETIPKRAVFQNMQFSNREDKYSITKENEQTKSSTTVLERETNL